MLRSFRYFSALFLESAETPLFVQINGLAVWPLRLDRKYTKLDVSQITHPIFVRLKLKHLLYDFFRGVLGFYIGKTTGRRPKHAPKSHIANVLGGQRLDE